MGLMATLKHGTRMNNDPIDTLSANDGARQNTSVGALVDKPLAPSRRRIGGVYGFALLLALVLFYFHVMVIFDVIGEMLRYKAWLLEKMGPKHTGKLLLLGCSFALMSARESGRCVGPLLALKLAVTQYCRGCILHRSIDHNAGLQQHPAEVSLDDISAR